MSSILPPNRQSDQQLKMQTWARSIFVLLLFCIHIKIYCFDCGSGNIVNNLTQIICAIVQRMKRAKDFVRDSKYDWYWHVECVVCISKRYAPSPLSQPASKGRSNLNLASLLVDYKHLFNLFTINRAAINNRQKISHPQIITIIFNETIDFTTKSSNQRAAF